MGQPASKRAARGGPLIPYGHPIPALDPAERRAHFGLCRSCAAPAGPYMVEAETWAAADIDPRGGELCLTCLDLRLITRRGIGNGLSRDDFPLTVPLNQLLIFALGVLAVRKKPREG